RHYYRSRPPDGCCLRSYPPTARDVSRRRNRSLRSGSIVLNILRASHLVNASLMPSTLEGCIEKAVGHAHGSVGRHEPRRDTEYVCVVVKACERCYFISPANRCANVSMFICRDGVPVAAAAKQHTHTGVVAR